MDAREETQALAQVVERLRRKFAGAGVDVDAVVTRCHHEFDGHPIRDFVPVLVERAATELLRGSGAGVPA